MVHDFQHGAARRKEVRIRRPSSLCCRALGTAHETLWADNFQLAELNQGSGEGFMWANHNCLFSRYIHSTSQLNLHDISNMPPLANSAN